MSELTIQQVEVSRVFTATGFMIRQKTSSRTRMERKMIETWADMDTWDTTRCKVCGVSMGETEEVEHGGIKICGGTCHDCAPLVDEHFGSDESTGTKIVKRHPKWDKECPFKFKEIIRKPDTLNTNIDWDAYNLVKAWEYSSKGMYIQGDSGLGKTTAIWHLYKNIENKTGTPPLLIKTIDLARRLAKAAKEMDDSQVKWFSRYKVLILDDLGKEKITPSFATQLFDLIDSRYESNRPTIITTKYMGGNLISRFAECGDDSTGNDIIRRLADTCDSIKFIQKSE